MTTLSELAALDARGLALVSRRRVSADLLGDYRSAFRGSGLVLADLREYQPGDEVRHIDWKSSARAGRVYVKSFEEERMLNVLLLFDVSPSMSSTLGTSLYRLALETSALIVATAHASGDLVGLCTFADAPRLFIPVRRARNQLARILSPLLQQQPEASTTNLAGALTYVLSMQRQASLIFLVSDFECNDFSDSLRELARRHDVIGVQVAPSIARLPSGQMCRVRDPESGNETVIDTASSTVRQALTTALEKRRHTIRTTFESSGAAFISVDHDPLLALRHFMRLHSMRRFAPAARSR